MKACRLTDERDAERAMDLVLAGIETRWLENEAAAHAADRAAAQDRPDQDDLDLDLGLRMLTGTLRIVIIPEQEG